MTISRTNRTISIGHFEATAFHRDERSRAETAAAVQATVAALGFVGLTAVAGGVEMIVAPRGNVFVQGAWLEDIPVFDSYRVPGCLLAGLGVAALGAGYGLVRRPHLSAMHAIEEWTGHHWSLAATGGVGAALSAWIAAEIAFVPRRSVIELLYGLVGLGLVGSCALPAVRRHTRPIQRA